MSTEKWLIDVHDVIKKLEYEIEFLCQPVDETAKGKEAFIGRVLPKLLRDVINYLNKQPTVDAVEVVHGRWINWGKSGTPTYENYGTCSVCHEDAEIRTEHRNYCPNCGAKMDVGTI